MLEDLKIAAGDNTPAVEFLFNDNIFKLSGMSYMEDVRSFYDDMMEKLNTHFESLENGKVKFIFDLDYFNSSSSRVIFTLFERLDAVAEAGNTVAIEWHFDDEDIGEEGEELAEDLENAEFQLIEK